MKKAAVFILLLLCSKISGAQIVRPVKWEFSVEQGKPGEATLVYKATIQKSWHLYSQFTSDGGPLPLVFNFDPNPCYERSGKVTEPAPHKDHDDAFDVDVLYFNDAAVFRQKIKLKGTSGCKITGTVNGQACKEVCMLVDTSFIFKIGKVQDAKEVKETSVPRSVHDSDTLVIVKSSIAEIKNGQLEPGCGKDEAAVQQDKSFIGIFIAGMLGGFLALLTPCVFPMIPLTVSFFTKRSRTRRRGIANAMIYAASIIVIYVALGLLVTIPLGPDALNDLATNAYFNLAFFFIFIIFAISFFGAFEITLPSAFVNKADAASERGGLIGIFFMAFTLSLVSFSCTGPIIGTLLVEAAHGRSYLGPFAGMTGFAVALALPFALFAAFPGWLNSLPKSGGWLNTVKVMLGFIELALAMKFLSNVDLAYHWGILKREIFISIWVIIAGMLGFYLLGKLRFAHDSEVTHISIARLVTALISLTFALYLLPGVWGAPLRVMSGILPPEFYKEWKSPTANECPHDLNCFHDYEEGMRYAKSQNKPVMIDFTGWNCPNCRRMEENVWSAPPVLKHLREDYVVISLYVDDKEELPGGKQITTSSGKKIRTTGGKWSDMQATRYNANTQPDYVLLDHNERLLANPVSVSSKEKFRDFLEEGLCRYKKRYSSN